MWAVAAGERKQKRTWPTSLKEKTIAREVMTAFMVPCGVNQLPQPDDAAGAAFVDAKRTRSGRMILLLGSYFLGNMTQRCENRTRYANPLIG